MDTNGRSNVNRTPVPLEALGPTNQAYIKRVSMDDGVVGYGIHAPDGRVLGVAPDREMAFAVARQHELEPVSAH